MAAAMAAAMAAMYRALVWIRLDLLSFWVG
jgi:hypothetical protein